jgi:hypothetical protein
MFDEGGNIALGANCVLNSNNHLLISMLLTCPSAKLHFLAPCRDLLGEIDVPYALASYQSTFPTISSVLLF